MGATVRGAARSLTWPLAPACLALSAALHAGPEGSEPLLRAADVPYVAAVAVTWVVGVVLTARFVSRPAGWAFLALGTVMAAGGLVDTYADRAVNDGAGSSTVELAATVSDTSWAWWFVLVAVVITLTPPERPTRWSRRLPALTLLSGLVYQVAALFRPTHLGPPYEAIVSPLALSGVAGDLATAVAAIAVSSVGACVLASVVALALAWRRAAGEERQQMLWLVAGGMPLGPSVIAAFALSFAGHEEVAGLPIALGIAGLATGAALSVLKYRLYDVERVVTDSSGYAAAAVAVMAVFLAVLAGISQTTPAGARSQLPTVLATLAAVAVARSVFVWGRRAAASHVNPDRFDAVESIRTGLEQGRPDLDTLVAEALRDPSARVLYPADDGSWVTAGGQTADLGPTALDLRRHGVLTAKVEYDPARSDHALVEAVAAAAATEIDNVALRAELARQVQQVSQSRSRLATAYLDERRRLERDLHDGAQQRLLALAFELQSARVRGDGQSLDDQVDRAVMELTDTVGDLRSLAAGLQPAALAGGGLLAAVADMSGRVPLLIHYDVPATRYPVAVETAAWFVISEAVTNIVKHADTDRATILVTSAPGRMCVTVLDCGSGGADPTGHGLQGLADRVAALHGTLSVTANEPRGTTVRAELPCVS